MTTQVTGHSDDIIQLNGDLYDELYPGYEEQKGAIGFSDGTLLKYEYDEDGIWRFKPVVKGSLFDHIEPGDAAEDTFDNVHFHDGLKWAILSRSEEGGFTLNRTKK